MIHSISDPGLAMEMVFVLSTYPTKVTFSLQFSLFSSADPRHSTRNRIQPASLSIGWQHRRDGALVLAVLLLTTVIWTISGLRFPIRDKSKIEENMCINVNIRYPYITTGSINILPPQRFSFLPLFFPLPFPFQVLLFEPGAPQSFIL